MGPASSSPANMGPGRPEVEQWAALKGVRGGLSQPPVTGFFSTLIEELGARRRRLRGSFGDRGQAMVEFLVMAGLLLGSAGLFLKSWMFAAAPWGIAFPPLFLAGFLVIELRRQAALSRGAEAEAVAGGYDWIVLIWSLGCAIGGAAAFLIALGAEPKPAPPAPEPPAWQPPEDVMEFELDSAPASPAK